ncbi:MAG: hypothetical protein JW797_06720, partial [Bradymonadales bacterium]|nr:hypothetical protein [Bradymonadales bacterium]
MGETGPVEPCGNGRIDTPEVCDDGELNGQYGHCNADCSGYGPRCGDGVVDQPHELCDDGELNGQYDRCGTDCTGPGPHCGDGIMQLPEFCDDGQLNGQYGQYGYCTVDCAAIGPRCGDGTVDEPDEACDEGGLNGRYDHCNESCTGEGPRCGDGTVDEDHEECDDGQLSGQYGYCRTDCSGLGPHCGDGTLDEDHEACDDGTLNGLYNYCATDCQGPASHCGDGIVDEPQEICDDGELNGQYGYCNTGCYYPVFPFPARPVGVSDEWLDDPPACETDDWFVKYLHYRRRLRGNGTADWPGFLSVGPDAGESIPATYHNPTTNCSNDWWIQVDAGCTWEYPEDADGSLAWGDATVWLGEYIAVLATEYAVFTRLGLDTTQTLDDLYYALNAFNRVDEAAEEWYGVPPARDGFFLRDDVPPDFMWDEDAGRYRFPRDDDGLLGYGCHTSVLSCQPPELDGGDYVSQDQVIGLIFGLNFVVRLVPDGIVLEGMDLRQEARAIVHRMVWHLRDNSWRVTAPNGDHPPDAWGGNAHGFSDQFAVAANIICGSDFGVEDYRDAISNTIGVATFEALELQVAWEATHNYNRTHAFRLVTVTG